MERVGQKSNSKALKTVSVNITERYKNKDLCNDDRKHEDDCDIDSREQ